MNGTLSLFLAALVLAAGFMVGKALAGKVTARI